MNTSTLIEDQWVTVLAFLPSDLEQTAWQHRAMRRRRGQITSADQLLRVLLVHIAGGLSLEQTVCRCKLRDIATLNAMALHKRLCQAGPWLEALTAHVLSGIRPLLSASEGFGLPGRRLRILDATDIQEPGATGTDWRLHYALRLPEMCCDFFELTDSRGGESLRRLPVQAGDVVLVDRVYNDRKAIARLVEAKADVILRYHSTALPLLDTKGKRFDPLPKLRRLKLGQVLDQEVLLDGGSGCYIKARLCALRKSPQAGERAEKKARHKARSSKVIRPATLEFAHYVVVITTLSAPSITAEAVMEFYRARWQVELAFKRLKSLLQLGQLPKQKDESCRAWMQGKILVALLIERILCEARYFSPWGYPCGRTQAVECVQGSPGCALSATVSAVKPE